MESTTSTTANSESIHCKIIYNDQIRRFIFNGTEFTLLKDTIAKMLSLNNEFVLKYQDDENDYVTLESQEDLITALTISPKMLRISVEKKNAPSHHHHHHGQGGRGGRGHHHHHHHGQGGRPEWRKMRIEKKLAWITQQLQDYGTDDSKLAPRDLFKKQRLLKKQQKLEAALKDEKVEKRVLTPEEEQVNYSLKLQMFEIKAEISKVKARIRELKLALQSKPGDKEILAEISSLKDRKSVLKQQKKALWEKFRT